MILQYRSSPEMYLFQRFSKERANKRGWQREKTKRYISEIVNFTSKLSAESKERGRGEKICSEKSRAYPFSQKNNCETFFTRILEFSILFFQTENLWGKIDPFPEQLFSFPLLLSSLLYCYTSITRTNMKHFNRKGKEEEDIFSLS